MIRLFDGRQCSNPWRRILLAARADGVGFVLNSGYRSYAKQAALYALYRARRGPIAAKPGTSTHNMTGWRQGMDIGPSPAAVGALLRWMKRHGLRAALTVRGEWWHLNLLDPPSEGQLRAMEKDANHAGRYEASLRRRLAAAYKSRSRQTRRSRVGFFNRRIQAIKRRLR